MPVAPLPIEDNLFRVTSNHLEMIGLRENDCIEVVPLNRYEIGQPVLANIQGHFVIGLYHPTPNETSLLVPSLNGNPGKRYVVTEGDRLVGLVTKADQAIVPDV